MDEQKLEGTEDVGRVMVLLAVPYHSHMIYVRRIGIEYFEYLLEYNGEIYSSYIIIKPREGETTLSEDEVSQARDLIYAGAEATLDELLGIDTLDEKQREYAELFEKNRERIEEGLEKEKEDATSI